MSAEFDEQLQTTQLLPILKLTYQVRDLKLSRASGTFDRCIGGSKGVGGPALHCM